jgi:hypothetical protein
MLFDGSKLWPRIVQPLAVIGGKHDDFRKEMRSSSVYGCGGDVTPLEELSFTGKEGS